jgi:hypothetical protein
MHAGIRLEGVDGDTLNFIFLANGSCCQPGPDKLSSHTPPQASLFLLLR